MKAIARIRPICFTLALVLFVFLADGSGVTFTWATIGDVGNPADPDTGTLYGSVSYAYRMATTEVTNGQYAEFLNAVAVTDPNALYNRPLHGGISRNGAPGSYSYSVTSALSTKPTAHASWDDAARFANWLHNGQPTGPQGPATTESGAYNMTVASPVRLAGAMYFLPSESEWYKAAHYEPGSASANGDDYWAYPTQSDTAPTAEQPPGGPNSANYTAAAGIDTPFTDVGSYIGTTSHYGLFDMAGGVLEWTEAIDGSLPGAHIVRGGGWLDFDFALKSDARYGRNRGSDDTGFRMATISTIPEPRTSFLVFMALIAGCARRRRPPARGSRRGGATLLPP